MKHTHLRSGATETPDPEGVGSSPPDCDPHPIRSFLLNHMGSLLIFVGLLIHSYEVLSAGNASREAQHIQQQTTLASMMGEFFHMLQPYNDVHERLGRGGDWFGSEGGPKSREDWTRLKRYAGLLEQIEVWHRHGIIDLKTMDSTYSHRIVRLYNNDVVREELLVKEEPHWSMFITLIDILKSAPSFKLRTTVAKR